MAAADDILLRLEDWSLVRRVPDGERTILSEIELELRAGEWLAVLGANGSGAGGLYLTNGNKDKAILVTPLGTVRVHTWLSGAWSS